MSILERVQTFLLQSLGWSIDIHQPTFEAKLKRICKELSFDVLQPCVESLQERETDSKTIEAFARQFSVGESYFFRNLQFYEYFEHTVIPKIVQKNERTLFIWSVGCSSGEELYSIAMILKNSILDIGMWKLYLLGTDVNPHAISQANSGVFTKFSFRQTPKHYMHYFKADNGSYKIAPEIKKMVQFRYHNIMSEPSSCLPPDAQRFDLILLKNVLIYFDSESAKTVANSLFHLLKEGGYLATTPAEYGEGVFNFPHSKYLPDACMIQKEFKPHEEIIIPKNEPEIIESVIENLLESVPKPKPQELQLDEKSKQSCYYDALKLLKIGDSEGAKVYLRHALYCDKNLVMAHILLGNILKKEQKLESAKKHINNAKTILIHMPPQEVVELSDGIMASDLLFMINSIKGEEFE
ncbi:MAG: CheR family methyltransferase [Sulfurimonas sp.]|nr:CheR family methyltransferase [Sulfurimonas sp.]